MIMMIDTDVLDVAEDGGSTDLLSWPLVIELLETNGLPTTRTATGSKGCCKAHAGLLSSATAPERSEANILESPGSSLLLN